MNLTYTISGPHAPIVAAKFETCGVGKSTFGIVYQQHIAFQGKVGVPYVWTQRDAAGNVLSSVVNNGGTPDAADMDLLNMACVCTLDRTRIADIEPSQDGKGWESVFRLGGTSRDLADAASIYECAARVAGSLYGFPRLDWYSFPPESFRRIAGHLKFWTPDGYWWMKWNADDYRNAAQKYMMLLWRHGIRSDAVVPIFTFTQSGDNKPVTVEQCRTMGDTWRALGCKRGHVWLGCDTLEQAEASAASVTEEKCATVRGS